MEGLEFNVSHLLRKQVGAISLHHVDLEEPLALDDTTTRRIIGDVELMRTNFGILSRAEVKAEIELECDRCLEPYVAHVSRGFAEEFLPVIDVSTGRPVQSERIDDTFFISPNHIVDLTEAMRQHLLLVIPMHKLCTEECLGLCSLCGANRNMRDCGCVQEEDHPLSAIAALLGDVGQPSG